MWRFAAGERRAAQKDGLRRTGSSEWCAVAMTRQSSGARSASRFSLYSVPDVRGGSILTDFCSVGLFAVSGANSLSGLMDAEEAPHDPDTSATGDPTDEILGAQAVGDVAAPNRTARPWTRPRALRGWATGALVGRSGWSQARSTPSSVPPGLVTAAVNGRRFHRLYCPALHGIDYPGTCSAC